MALFATSNARHTIGTDTNMRRRSAALDGLRAFAVMGVVLSHAGFNFRGAFGVPAFFVLSGFLITGILTQEHAQHGTIDFRKFYMHRVIRLVPALVFVFAALVPLSLFYTPAMSFRTAIAWSALYNATMMTNWAAAFPKVFPYPDIGLLPQTWTLGVEWQFYLLWPVVLRLMLRKISTTEVGVAVLILAVALGIWKECFWDLGWSRKYFTHATDMNVDGLLIGAAAALCRRRIADYAISTSGAALSFGVTAVLVFIRFGIDYGVGLRVTIFEIATALLILNLAYGGRNFIKVVFESAPVAYIGRISYSLYLWHLPIHFIVESSGWFNMHDYLHIAFEVGVSIVLAALSFHLIEVPVSRIYRRRSR